MTLEQKPGREDCELYVSKCHGNPLQKCCDTNPLNLTLKETSKHRHGNEKTLCWNYCCL